MFGDIVTYEENDVYITHRIVKKENNSFFAKGDNNNEIDIKKDNDKIIGKVVFHSLIIGIFITKYLKYIIIIFSVIVIMRNIYLIYKDYKQEGEEINEGEIQEKDFK